MHTKLDAISWIHQTRLVRNAMQLQQKKHQKPSQNTNYQISGNKKKIIVESAYDVITTTAAAAQPMPHPKHQRRNLVLPLWSGRRGCRRSPKSGHFGLRRWDGVSVVAAQGPCPSSWSTHRYCLLQCPGRIAFVGCGMMGGERLRVLGRVWRPICQRPSRRLCG
jgi:hypothetical protein